MGCSKDGRLLDILVSEGKQSSEASYHPLCHNTSRPTNMQTIIFLWILLSHNVCIKKEIIWSAVVHCLLFMGLQLKGECLTTTEYWRPSSPLGAEWSSLATDLQRRTSLWKMKNRVINRGSLISGEGCCLGKRKVSPGGPWWNEWDKRPVLPHPNIMQMPQQLFYFLMYDVDKRNSSHAVCICRLLEGKKKQMLVLL